MPMLTECILYNRKRELSISSILFKYTKTGIPNFIVLIKTAILTLNLASVNLSKMATVLAVHFVR